MPKKNSKRRKRRNQRVNGTKKNKTKSKNRSNNHKNNSNNSQAATRIFKPTKSMTKQNSMMIRMRLDLVFRNKMQQKGLET